MAPEDLGAFVRLLEERGELRRVAVEVDPRLEVAAVTDRVCKGAGGGKALLFEKVRGHPFPVLTNLFGSPRRAAWALGSADLADLAGRLAGAPALAGPGDAGERLRRLTAPFCPRRTADAPCREVTAEPDLRALPALQSWPQDGGRYLTLPLVFTRHPQTGETNCGMYRLQLFDARTAGLHWRPDSDGARHHAAWRARGEAMPVAVVLGGPPPLIWAAGAPLPAGVDEAAFAGFLGGRPLEVTPCPGGGLEVPATAEFVLEGEVAPGEERPEGPFGNHTGFYVPAAPAPVFRLTRLTRRRAPLFPATVVGPPPMEDCWLAKATERLLLPLLRQEVPEVVDLNLPLATIFHGCALVAVRGGGREGREILRALWQTTLLRRSRLLVLLDAEAQVQNEAETFWRAVNQATADEVVIEAGRVGIDATGRGRGGRLRGDAATRQLIEARWREYGID